MILIKIGADEDIEMATVVACKYGLKLNIINLHDVYWKYRNKNLK